MTAPLTASDVLAGALQVCAELKAQLLEDSATSRRALTNAEDAIGAFEKEATLLGYEVKRQRNVAADRAARAAEARCSRQNVCRARCGKGQTRRRASSRSETPCRFERGGSIRPVPKQGNPMIEATNVDDLDADLTPEDTLALLVGDRAERLDKLRSKAEVTAVTARHMKMANAQVLDNKLPPDDKLHEYWTVVPHRASMREGGRFDFL